MPAAWPAMTAPAENSDLIYEIAFFQKPNFVVECKYTLCYGGICKLSVPPCYDHKIKFYEIIPICPCACDSKHLQGKGSVMYSKEN
jgi:hypothetical protein